MKNGGLKLNMNFNVTPTSKPVFTYILKIALIIFGATTAVKALADPCWLTIDYFEVLAVVVPVVAVGLLLRLIPKSYKWVRTVCGLILSFFYIMTLGIREIYYGAECIITRLINEDYTEVDILVEMYGEYYNYQYVEVTICALTFLVTILLFISTISNVNMGLQILATLPLYSVSYIVGMKPGIVVFQMLAFYVACYCMARSDFKARYINEKEIDIYEECSTQNVVGQIISIMLAAFVVICVVYLFINPVSKYKKPEIVKKIYEEVIEKTIEYVKENIDKLDDKVDEEDLTPNEAVTGFANGKLGEFDKINLSNEVQLVLRDVSSNISGTIYLKGETASRYYSGTSVTKGRSFWEDSDLTSIKTLNTVYDENIFIRLGNYSYKVLGYHDENRDDIVTGNMTVEKINRFEKNYFEPPYTLSSMEREYDLSFDEDNNYENDIELMVAHMDMGPITRAQLLGGKPMSDFYVMGTAFLESKEGEPYKFEVNTYNISAYKSYTYSDKGIINALAQYPEFNSFIGMVDVIRRTDDEASIENMEKLDTAISAIMTLLAECRYTLAPGATPVGEDFVTYFLIETKQGYCTHFASTMAAILQELGHPARYVTGYMVDAPEHIEGGDETYSLSVPQLCAHAWVEVYVDNFGWVTVEPTAAARTGGYDGNGFDVIIDEDMVIDDNIVTTPDVDDENDKNDDNSDDDKDNKKKSFKLTKKSVIAIVIIAIVLVAALIIFMVIKRRQLKLEKIEGLLNSDEPSEKFKGLLEISKDLVKLTKAPELFMENRNDTAEGIYKCIYDTINRKEFTKKQPEPEEPILTKNEYLYLMDALCKGIYDKEYPDNKKIENSADFVVYTTEIIYGEKGKLSQFFLKYIKCLYLK